MVLYFSLAIRCLFHPLSNSLSTSEVQTLRWCLTDWTSCLYHKKPSKKNLSDYFSSPSWGYFAEIVAWVYISSQILSMPSVCVVFIIVDFCFYNLIGMGKTLSERNADKKQSFGVWILWKIIACVSIHLKYSWRICDATWCHSVAIVLSPRSHLWRSKIIEANWVNSKDKATVQALLQ